MRMVKAGYTGRGGGNVPILFDNVMWDYINRLDSNTATFYAFYGQLYHYKVAAGAYQVEIGAADRPAGVYASVVQIKTGVEKIRLMK